MNFRLNAILIVALAFMISCSSEEKAEDITSFDSPAFQRLYLEKGHKISEDSFNALRLNLMQAMGANGISGAAEFCNIEAYPITDSLSEAFDAQIRRTTLKWRNPKNQPTEKEREILEFFESVHNAGTQPKDSLIKLNDDEIWYVRPIFVQGICQNCHGSLGSTLAENNYEVIKKLYPEDAAVGYKSGDLRGMWSIKLKVQKEN